MKLVAPCVGSMPDERKARTCATISRMDVSIRCSSGDRFDGSDDGAVRANCGLKGPQVSSAFMIVLAVCLLAASIPGPDSERVSLKTMFPTCSTEREPAFAGVKFASSSCSIPSSVTPRAPTAPFPPSGGPYLPGGLLLPQLRQMSVRLMRKKFGLFNRKQFTEG